MCVSVSDEAHMGTWGIWMRYGNGITLYCMLQCSSSPSHLAHWNCVGTITSENGQVLARAWDRHERGSKFPDSTCWKSGRARGNTLDDSRRLAGIHRTIPEGSGTNKSSLEASRRSLLMSCVFSSFEKRQLLDCGTAI